MDRPKQPAAPTGKIPVLFDIVKRGKNAPAENQMVPPPPLEETEFRLGGIEPDSEDPTVLPLQPNTNTTEFSLDELEDTTLESPIIPASMLDDGQSVSNELVEQAMKKLMPQLEALARETVNQLVNSNEQIKDSEQQQ